MIKDLIISALLAVSYLLSVIALTVLTVNILDTYVDLGIFPYLLFGFFYTFVAYDVYYEPILDTI